MARYVTQYVINLSPWDYFYVCALLTKFVVMKYERKIPIDLECGVTIYDIMAGGKWKPYLVNCMNRGIKRPSEFCRIIPGATRRVLQQQLNEMELMELVTKKVFAEIPLRVEYSLTERGESLVPIIRMMDGWGLKHASLFDGFGNYLGGEGDK